MRYSNDDLIGDLFQNFFEADSDDLIGDLSQNFFEADGDILSECSRSFLRYLSFSTGCLFIIKSARDLRIVQDLRQLDLQIRSNLGNAIIFQERSCLQNRKYKAEEISFRVRIDPDHLPDVPLAAATNSLQEFFEILIENSIINLRATDLKFCIQADRMGKSISTNIMPVSDLMIGKLLYIISKVLQSKNQIQMDLGFIVVIIAIIRDIGAGLNRRVISVEIDKLRKQSILSIPTGTKSSCSAKAVLYGLAHLEKGH